MAGLSWSDWRVWSHWPPRETRKCTSSLQLCVLHPKAWKTYKHAYFKLSHTLTQGGAGPAGPEGRRGEKGAKVWHHPYHRLTDSHLCLLLNSHDECVCVCVCFAGGGWFGRFSGEDWSSGPSRTLRKSWFWRPQRCPRPCGEQFLFQLLFV